MTIQMTLPNGCTGFRLPEPLSARLTELLDRQNVEGTLSARDRKEAEALTELVDFLALLKAESRVVSAGTEL